jgi:hypothetical protein
MTGVLGLVRSATAQVVDLPPISAGPASAPAPVTPPPPAPASAPAPVTPPPPAPATRPSLAPTISAPALVRPPIPLPRSSQVTESASSAKPATKPRVAVFASDQPGQSVNLLAVPDVPSSWAADADHQAAPAAKTSPPAPGVVLGKAVSERSESWASSAPARQQVAPKAERTIEVMPLPPLSLSPESAPDRPAPLPPVSRAPKKLPAVWATQHAPMPAKTKEWPAAFVEYEPHYSAGLKTVAAKEPQWDPPAPPPGPIVPAQLQHKLARACGGVAAYVQVVVRPDRSLTVKVRPLNPSVEGELLDRLTRVPEMASPLIRVEIDTRP